MAAPRRWIASAMKEAATTKTELPWTRGPRRDAFIAKRKASAPASGSPRRASA